MILYIVRHGIALDRTDVKCPPDAERPLTAKGLRKSRLAALGMRALGVDPGIMIASPYLRAAQTAEIFADVLGFPPEKIRTSEALKPAANPADAVREISSLKIKEIMCFGHAPQLDLMIALLAGAPRPFTELKKAGIACFERAAVHGRWGLLWLLPANILRELGG